jgi:hypothetical protein
MFNTGRNWGDTILLTALLLIVVPVAILASIGVVVMFMGIFQYSLLMLIPTLILVGISVFGWYLALNIFADLRDC